MSCASPPFEIRQGDTLPRLEGLATYKDRFDKIRAFNFTGWTNLTFTMIKGATTVTGAATGNEAGLLTYQWSPGDTAIPGRYLGTFHGTSPEGFEQTFPTKGSIQIDVTT